MARRSKRQNMKALSALLFLVVAGLVTAGVIKLRQDYFLTGTQLIGWAFVPLAILLGFTFPTTCKVKRTNRKACGNESYGFLFGYGRVRLSERCLISGCFGHAARLRSSMVAGS